MDNLGWKEFSGKDGVLTKTLKARIGMERTRREFLCSSSLALKMHSSVDATNEGESVVYEEEKVQPESRSSFTFKERFTTESNVERRSNQRVRKDEYITS
ncbi:hypothetical protein Bca52824_000487 [Brassica carinata]|uniref:Uncharacterized protein n=1 Tax=Brassica carinata TaxID=52824 RepID=A0A8X8BCV9_BRACI|nr:hypothetical protein Bca52824_000487 [Brassica carinata]